MCLPPFPQPCLLVRVKRKAFSHPLFKLGEESLLPSAAGRTQQGGVEELQGGHDNVPRNLPESPGENPKGESSTRAVY